MQAPLRGFVLLGGDRQAGVVSFEMLSRRMEVDLLADLPLTVRVFVIRLCTIALRRRSRAAA